MLSSILKFLKLCFYILLVLLGVVFAVGNRAKVDITFYPLPYVLSMPLFMLAIIMFAVGLIVGWMLARFKSFRHHRSHKDDHKRINALENELGAIRSEHLLNHSQ